MPEPMFSLLHATARVAGGWHPAHRAWSQGAHSPARVEYLVGVDEYDLDALTLPRGGLDFQLYVNYGRRCNVDAVNLCARMSRGKVLVQVADDFYPPQDWDTALLSVIPDVNEPWTVLVSTGHQPDLMQHVVMTRPYYERYGYVYYPEYLSMGADDDLTEKAWNDGVMIDARGRADLVFDHRHSSRGAPWDAVYAHEQREEAWEVKDRVLARRRKEGFPR